MGTISLGASLLTAVPGLDVLRQNKNLLGFGTSSKVTFSSDLFSELRRVNCAKERGVVAGVAWLLIDSRRKVVVTDPGIRS